MYSVFSRSSWLRTRVFRRTRYFYQWSKLNFAKMDVHLSGGNETACVFWLQGLGDTPHGWADMARKLKPKMSHIKWILPCAPTNPVTCNAGYESTSWMDLMEIPIRISSPDNGVQQEESIKIIHDLIEREINSGTPSERIVLGGFSQGAALALACSLKFDKKLGGCVVFSGWALPHQQLDKTIGNSINKDIPFMVAHGKEDNVVLTENGVFVSNLLKEANAQVKLHLYEGMPHSSCPEEMNDLEAFLKATLP